MLEPRRMKIVEGFASKLFGSLRPHKLPLLRELQQVPLQIRVSEIINNTCVRLLDAFVDSVFEFHDQPLLPYQSNFAPVEELGEAVLVTKIEGRVPDDFPEGVYIRNGQTLFLED